MRHKYIDEAVGFYFIFGQHEAGTVDISDGTRDVFINLPEQTANKIIRAQHEFLEKLYKIFDERSENSKCPDGKGQLGEGRTLPRR